MTRILVTGSREWTDRVGISRAILGYIVSTIPLTRTTGNTGQEYRYRDTSDVVIVHGAARGADRLVDEWAQGCDPPLKTEPHPVTRADWQENPRIAGYMRNAAMVRLGADVCIAFQMPCRKVDCQRPEPHVTHGSAHCADLAEAAGIMTVRVSPR